MTSDEERTATAAIIKELWGRDRTELLQWLDDIVSGKVQRPPYPNSTWTRFAEVSKSKIGQQNDPLAMARIVVFVLDHLPELWGVPSDSRHRRSIAMDARSALSVRAQMIRKHGHHEGDPLLDVAALLRKFKEGVGLSYEEVVQRLGHPSTTSSIENEHEQSTWLTDTRELVSILRSLSAVPEVRSDPECERWLSLLNHWPTPPANS